MIVNGISFSIASRREMTKKQFSSMHSCSNSLWCLPAYSRMLNAHEWVCVSYMGVLLWSGWLLVKSKTSWISFHFKFNAAGRRWMLNAGFLYATGSMQRGETWYDTGLGFSLDRRKRFKMFCWFGRVGLYCRSFTVLMICLTIDFNSSWRFAFDHALSVCTEFVCTI